MQANLPADSRNSHPTIATFVAIVTYCPPTHAYPAQHGGPVTGPNSSPLYRSPNLTNSHREKTGSPLPPTSSMKGPKPANRRKTYLITSPYSVSILSTREEVHRAHRVEVESCTPHTIIAIVNTITDGSYSDYIGTLGKEGNTTILILDTRYLRMSV